MFRRYRLFAWLFLILLAVGGHAQEKVLLQTKAKPGQVVRMRQTGTITIEAAGRTFNLEVKAVTVVKILEVTPEGNIKSEQTLESYEMSLGGNKVPTPEEVLNEKTTVTIKPNGELIARESTRNEEQQGDTAHLNQALDLIFSEAPVGVGDRWTYEFKEDSKLRTLPGRLEITLIGFDTWKGIRVARLKTSYTAGGDSKLTAESEHLVEVRSGSSVYITAKVENMNFGQGQVEAPASAQMEIERIEGSPLPEETNGQQPAPATDQKQEEKPAEQAKQEGEKKDGEKKEEPSKKKEKTIEEVTKDFEKLEGLFTLYRKKEAGKDTLYMEVREDQLEKLYFLQSTVSEGLPSIILAPGRPISDILFKFVKREEQILLVVPNYGFQAPPNTPIERSVRRSFADAYLEAFKIEAKDPEGKKFLIDVSNLFRSDLIQIQQLASLAAGGSYSIDREKTVYTQVKVFPTNLFIQTAYHFTGGQQRGGGGLGGILGGFLGSANLADPRSLPLTVNYNLWELPTNNGYRPRYYDPRVGYFTTELTNIANEVSDQTQRYILRWHLEKADPNAELSPPKEPIVFWLDNAIPVEYRDAIREGLLEWNKAFEKIGFKDAIVVKQMPDDADWDHADMRYNVIRWVSSPGNGYAVALFRANPLTGQILNASITIDGNMARFTRVTHLYEIDPLSAFREAEQQECCPNHPLHDSRVCTIGQETRLRAFLGYLQMTVLAPLRGATKISEDQFVKDYLRSITMHEMGHILGLRHNFVASRMNSLEDLKDGEKVRQRGTVASVMEYDPFNQMALHTPNNVYWNPTIGPYDYWAIEYGYRVFPEAQTAEQERAFLLDIARKNTRPELAYETDDYADRFDPYVTRFDLSKDPIEYWELTMKDTEALIQLLPAYFPRPNESYNEFTRLFFGTVANYSRVATQLSRYIGALQIRRNFPTDPGAQPPLQVVDGQTQRRALRLLTEYIFSPNAFPFPKGYYELLAPNPYDGFRGGAIPPDSPVRDFLSNIQRLTLTRLMAADTLRRVVNNEFKSVKSPETFTLVELFETLYDAIWAEAKSGQEVSALRRLLQRTHLQLLVDMLVKNPPVPDDAKMLARYQLRQLKAQLERQLPKTQDLYTRAHYTEAIDIINQALDAKYMLGMPEVRVPSLADLLGLLGKQP